MNLRYVGPVLFAFTFIVGFAIAPVHFKVIRSGSGALTGGHNSCTFSVYSSTHLEDLSRWSCAFEEESQAREYFETVSIGNTFIERSESYELLRIKEPAGDYYCSTRRAGRFITNLCSHSLRNMKEFESR